MYNPYLVVPFVSWLVAQLIKFLLKAFKGDISPSMFYASGGMPSAHTAVVVSLASVALVDQGADSAVFGVTAILALIVMYDALGVRRMAGEQAAAFNKLMRVLEASRLAVPGGSPVRELRGHTPSEVLAGAGLGLLMSGLFNTSELAPQFEWLTQVPTKPELIGLACLFGGLIVAGFVFKAVVKRRFKGSSAIAKLAEAILIKTQAIGWPGLLFVFGAYQKASYLAWRLWPLILILTLLIWDITLFKKYRRSLPKVLADESEQLRKQRWLKNGKK